MKNPYPPDNKVYSNMRKRCLRRDEDVELGAELIEDTTQYPEFIPSFDNWISTEKQKKRARELENMTDK